MNRPTHDAAVSSDLVALILAAGKGTRMKSTLPKVLHPVAGRPMLDRMLQILTDAGIKSSVVVLSEDLVGFERFLESHDQLGVAIQQNRQGTGDAVAASAWNFAGVKPAPYAAGRALKGKPIDCKYVLILAGDTPAVRAETLQAFISDVRASGAAVGVLGMRTLEPFGYGRMVTKGRDLLAIVEEKDADAEIKKIDVCNTGVILAEKTALFELLAQLEPNNTQKEYYLTDIVTVAVKRGLKAIAHVSDAWRDFAGINDRAQLATVERWIVDRKIASLAAAGVTCHSPATLYIEPEVAIEADAEIRSGARLAGSTRIASGAVIGAGVSLTNVIVGARAVIGDGSVLSHCSVPAGEHVPPLSARSR